MTAVTSAVDHFRPAGSWSAPADLAADGAVDPAGVEGFLYEEAALLEEGRLDDWLALFTDDARYWIPLAFRTDDPGPQVNLVYDNRALLGDRVSRLQTGEVPSQDPPSRTVRTLSNLVLAPTGEPGDILARTSFVLIERRPRAQNLYAGWYRHRLRRGPDGLRIAGKKVELINSDEALPSLTFLP